MNYSPFQIVGLFEHNERGVARNTERIISSGFSPNRKTLIRDDVYIEFVPRVHGIWKMFYYKESRINMEKALQLLKRGWWKWKER